MLAARALLPAGGALYGPQGVGHLAGAPAEQNLYKPLRDPAQAERFWAASTELAKVDFALRSGHRHRHSGGPPLRTRTRSIQFGLAGAAQGH